MKIKIRRESELLPLSGREWKVVDKTTASRVNLTGVTYGKSFTFLIHYLQQLQQSGRLLKAADRRNEVPITTVEARRPDKVSF